ncbi:MAG: endolytic transglycosylase MltG [Actinobacteria bacterium]|nr:endolytic transglycosylase MltG [Actinomycetota bacterium]
MKARRGNEELARGKHVAKENRSGRGPKIIIAAIASLAVVLGVVIAIVIPALTSPSSKPKSSGREVVVTIKKGWTAGEIGDELAGKKVVESPLFFRLYIRYKGLGDKLRPGEYLMREGMTYEEAVSILMKGPPDRYVTITIPEGYTIDQEAEILSKSLKIDKEKFKVLAKTGSQTFAGEFQFLSSNRLNTLEGYLFPDTYRFKPNATAEDVIRAQLAQFKRVTADLDLTSTGRSVHDAVTIASLVEREARIAEERPLISAVIGNRLEKGMLLQIDATVQYALPRWKKELTYKDLEIESPYNTYKHPGLPPGAIGAPGLDSIKAAANPANVDYLYYVVIDQSGRHFFTSNYNEFLKAKAKSPKP